MKKRIQSAGKAKDGADGLAGRKPDPLPPFVPPCLATLSRAPPSGDDWVHEIKFDGYRLQARIENGAVTLLTRSGLDWTGRFASLEKALRTLAVSSAVLDGEAVVYEQGGATSFSALVAALDTGRSADMQMMLFDLLYLDGVDLRAAPLVDRKQLLAAILKRSRSKRLRFSEHIAGDGQRMLDEACKLGLEGIISKRADRPYRPGRSGDWLKSKCVATDEFVIGGYLVSRVDAKAVGALALGSFEKGRFVYAGRVGTGFSHAVARALWTILQPLKSPAPPFETALSALQRRGVVWVRPELVAQIAFRGWTGDGLLRHAAFKGLREDKAARDVRRPGG